MLCTTQRTRRLFSEVPEKTAKAQLARTGYRELNAINCSFRDGQMVLRGKVPTYYHKQLAQEALRNVEDVTQIVNHIEVLV